jgi:hypothetical protein
MSRNPRNNWSSVPVPAHTSWSCVLFFFVFFFSFFGSAEVTSLHAALPLLSAVGRLCGSSGMAGRRVNTDVQRCRWPAWPRNHGPEQLRERSARCCDLPATQALAEARRRGAEAPRRRGAKAKAPRRCSNGACTGRAGTACCIPTELSTLC